MLVWHLRPSSSENCGQSFCVLVVVKFKCALGYACAASGAQGKTKEKN